jgi:hypothetical protein
VEQVPRPGSDPDVVVVHQPDVVFEHLRDITLLVLEEVIVSGADFHILQNDCRVRVVGDAWNALVGTSATE